LKRTQFIFSCFRTPLAEKRPKRTKKTPKNKVRTYVLVFVSWRRCTSVSRFTFSAAPCPTPKAEGRQATRDKAGGRKAKQLTFPEVFFGQFLGSIFKVHMSKSARKRDHKYWSKNPTFLSKHGF
jgi:hypothetical protein